MFKHPFIIFSIIVGTLIASLLGFVESPRFASVLKKVASKYIPKDVGIQADFSEISVKFFPPGFSLKNPKVAVGPRNIANLPAGSFVSAERMDFSFQFFQIFSGDIRVNELTVVNGQVQILADQLFSNRKSQSKKARLDFHWDELFHIRAEALALKNVEFKVNLGSQESAVISGNAENLRLAQWSGKGGLGYFVHLSLNHLHGSFLKTLFLPEKIESIHGDIYVNALGLQLESLLISLQGLETSIHGQVKGNLLDTTSLKAEASIHSTGSLETVLRSYFGKGLKSLPSGQISLRGKVQGNLSKLNETLKAEGFLSIKNFSYDKWTTDSIEVEAKWASALNGDEVSLTKVIVSSVEKPRIGGNQPGSGGRIEIGPTKWTVGSLEPIKVSLQLNRAHLHWLAAPALNQIYPLDFRLNGIVQAAFIPGQSQKPWKLRVDLNSVLEEFQLDNQRHQQEKIMKIVFKIPKINLNGSLLVNEGGIQPIGLLVTLPHTKLRLDGKLDFKSGYDLLAHGNISLKDLGQIAENDIRGDGLLNLHVYGPSSSVLVDIDADLQEAYYLRLFLGGLKGRMTWDDDPSRLFFKGVEVAHQSTRFKVDGVLDVGKVEQVTLKVGFRDGNIQDLIQVFGNLTQSLDWFPQKLNGLVSGSIDLSGGLSYADLKVLTELEGTNWEYWNERFKTVHLVGGYEKEQYFISQGKIKKQSGSLIGKIYFGSKNGIFWDLQTENLTLSDLDHFSQLAVPVRGRLTFKSQGKGREGMIRSSTHIEFQDCSVRGVGIPPSFLEINTDQGSLSVQGSAEDGQGLIDFFYDWNPKARSYVHLELKQFDFSPVLLLLNQKSMQDRSLAGRLSGILDLSFYSGEVEKSTGFVSVTEYFLARQGTEFLLEKPFSFEMRGGDFDIKNIFFKGKSGITSFNLRNQNSRLEGFLGGDLDISIVEFFIPSIVQAIGGSKLDFIIGGTLKSPSLFGKIQLGNNTLRIASFESPLENVTGTLQLRQNVLSFQKIQADLGGGRVIVDGKITINSDRYPTLEFKSQITGSKFKVYPFQYAKINGNMRIFGEKPPYLIDGDLFIDSAFSKEKLMNQKNSAGSLKALQYIPPSTQQGESNYPKFKLNLKVEASKGIVIQNDLFRDVQAKGRLTLVNTLESPRVLGQAEIIQGKIIFKNHVFIIQSATANFDSPTVINPIFDLTANTEVNSNKIKLYASGRADKFKVEFTSNPAMQESEILTLLTVGLTSNDAQKLSANALSAVQQGEAASLVLHSLDFNREIEDKTGFRLQLDESVNAQQGTSVFRPLSQAEAAAAPKITLRRKLGDRLSLSAGSTVGTGTNRSNQVNVDFSVNQDLSLTGVFNNYGTYGNADVQSTTQSTQNSYGLDFKFQKRFK